jgi:membrane AbrB-like protein
VQNWPIVLGGVLSTVIASSYLGWQISRWGVLPGATAILGSAPGAASAMVLMAGAFGADFRLVAFMQYLRVTVVALVAAGLAAFLVDTSAVEATSAPLFPPIDWPIFALTMLIALAGATFGRLLRLPSPYFFGTLVLGIALHLGIGVPFELPPMLLSLGYVMVGWSIGLNFTRPIVKHATRALPQVLGSILLLILLSAFVGWMLSIILDIDFLTAYLATSPGGMDAVAIIAAASGNADMSLIMAMQMARFLFVLVFGPVIVRVLAKTLKD